MLRGVLLVISQTLNLLEVPNLPSVLIVDFGCGTATLLKLLVLRKCIEDVSLPQRQSDSLVLVVKAADKVLDLGVVSATPVD